MVIMADKSTPSLQQECCNFNYAHSPSHEAPRALDVGKQKKFEAVL